jgi:MFS family permease
MRLSEKLGDDLGSRETGHVAAADLYQNLRTIGLVAAGGSVVYYDFVVFAFLAPVIGKVFFPAGIAGWLAVMQSFGIFAAGYVFRPLGGIALAHFGDLFGRKQLFAFSILLMSVATLGMAVLPDYATAGVAAPLLLICLRVLQGVAIGGEVPGAWTLIAEQMPRRHVGLACALVSSSFTAGILLASVIVALLNSIFSAAEMEAFAWRIPFVLGALFSLPAIGARWRLKETPVFSALRDRWALVPELPLVSIFRNHLRAIVVSVLLTWVLSAGILVTGLMTATLLQTVYGFSAQHALVATSIGTFALILGTAIVGVVIDRLGAGVCLMGGSIFFGAATFSFYSFAGHSFALLCLLYVIMGLAVGLVAVVPYVMVNAFPARVRVTGVSFSYNISYAVFGGLTPVLLTWLVEYDPMATAYYLVFIAVLAGGLGAYIIRNKQMLEPHPDDLRLGIWGG